MKRNKVTKCTLRFKVVEDGDQQGSLKEATCEARPGHVIHRYVGWTRNSGWHYDFRCSCGWSIDPWYDSDGSRTNLYAEKHIDFVDNDRHPQNDQRQRMLPRDWHGCEVRITWSAIGGAMGRTGRVVEARCPIASPARAIDQSKINVWILLDEPIECPCGNDVTLIPVQINGACDQLEILTPRGGR